MIRLFLIAAAAFILPVCASAQCPVTTPAKSTFVPPPPYRTNAAPDDGFYYGTRALWTWIPNDPAWWRGGEKIVYWRAGFDARKEHQPDLKIVARRLDAPAPLVWGMRTYAVWFPEDGVTHTGAPGDMAMMSGIDISQAGKGGCWEITAHYENAERTEDQTLSFVVLVP
jgi:hypothetical protein